MEPTLQGFLDFHGETIKTQYDLYIESLKPREDDINTITNCLEKVNITENSRNDDIDTITDSIKKVKIEEKRRCRRRLSITICRRVRCRPR